MSIDGRATRRALNGKFDGAFDFYSLEAAETLGLIGPAAFYTNTTIIITAAGGSFTGGQVRLSISILLANPSAA